MRKPLAVGAAIVLAAATNLWAVGEARLTGKVVDSNDKPIEAAQILVESLGSRPFKQTYQTKKDGSFSIFLLDGTQQYRFTASKEGYAPSVETMKLKLNPERNEHVFKLVDPASAQTTETQVTFAEADPATVIYNEGVKLANEGKTAEAIAKFEEALAAKPNLTAAVQALVQVSHRAGNWAKAIEYGERVLEISPDEPQIFMVLADSYEKIGNKAKAAEYAAKAPKNATSLFNNAAKLINAGQMEQAAPLLEQAIVVDPEFADAYYELGMLYAGMGKNPGAKKNLEKYLQLEPAGKNVATAREMLQYVSN